MLAHPDPETQMIFALLEKQRDDAVLEAGRQAAKVRTLESQVAALQEPVPPEPTEDELRVN